MDERDAMAMSGASPYFQHRGFGTSGGSGWQLGAQGPQSIQSFSSPNPSHAVHSSNISGGSVGPAFQGETPASISPNVGINVGGHGGITQSEPVKKKRGRPRKYGPDGTVSLGLSSTTSPRDTDSGGLVSVSGSGSATPTQKRGRGRPPGTGKKQQLASYGEWISSSAGMGFTPHIIMIPAGEDIATKILSFSQQGPRAVCILSATGAVSTVTLRQYAASGGTVSYEGRFEILSLSGSYLLTDDGGPRSRSGGISVSLAGPDGRVIGGGVGGVLIAATQVQVVVGSFTYGGPKPKSKTKPTTETESEQDHSVDDEKQSTPSSTQQVNPQTFNPIIGGWPGSRPLDMRNSHADFDLTRG